MRVVRVHGEKDWPQWVAVREAGLADTSDYTPPIAPDWAQLSLQQWRDMLNDPDALKVLILDDDRPVGVVRGVRDGTWALLHSLWVAPDLRGRGLAGQLVEAVEQWAHEWGARYVMLSVGPDNEPALTLYRRYGFVEAGIPGHCRADGVREVIYRLDLQDRTPPSS
ncbi:GNAT family N-acetyltransferase [Enemella sp. A6]|uniref:GNAT family N-acetyltransferase n=1 Tax=Enemella sp. A6 TaxID=3440152 RepID=UPI003EBBFA59